MNLPLINFLQAQQRIRPYIQQADIIHSPFLSQKAGGDVWLKLENQQPTGSFKVRGAFTNLLTRRVPAAGVVAASGGNHGIAVAYAARRLGKPASIFVPEVTSPTLRPS